MFRSDHKGFVCLAADFFLTGQACFVAAAECYSRGRLPVVCFVSATVTVELTRTGANCRWVRSRRGHPAIRHADSSTHQTHHPPPPDANESTRPDLLPRARTLWCPLQPGDVSACVRNPRWYFQARVTVERAHTEQGVPKGGTCSHGAQARQG